ncbi:uncharacterized protein LOC135824915 [Sycon ciliatum]|uniref:uncharacterized protein LOC135824915 n=1 Tax=Sycon ciliatum TaxID=27933 RepID=UPI0031F66070
MDDHESAVNGLESVHFDVWQDVLLPMLSIQDVFQLCAASKSMQRLLFNEYTFRQLCMQRYHLSPRLKVPYIRVAKLMFIAHKVATNFYIDDERTTIFSIEDPANALGSFLNTFVQLLSLALMSPAIAGLKPSWTNAALRDTLVKGIYLHPEEASLSLPNITPVIIMDRCTPINPDSPIGSRRYRIEDISNLLLEICGPLEQYQEAIINRLDEDMPRLEAILPFVNGSLRVVEFAKSLHGITKSDTKICLYLELVDLDVYTDVPFEWTYKPYMEWALLYNVNDQHLLDFSDPVLVTREWIYAIGELVPNHSVFRLLVLGRLRTSEAGDYFTAITVHEAILSFLPQYRRPNRHNLYDGLGTFLLSSSQGQEYQKEWTMVELVDAMLRYGNELTGKELTGSGKNV